MRISPTVKSAASSAAAGRERASRTSGASRGAWRRKRISHAMMHIGKKTAQALHCDAVRCSCLQSVSLPYNRRRVLKRGRRGRDTQPGPESMPHTSTPLIATIVIGLSLAFVFGAIAARLRLSPLVGYLCAGVAVGPFTPGFVADGALAGELAEMGVILLMFGVGLHFSFKDLLSVRAIALPGAIAQIVAATLMGVGLGVMLG